MIVVPTAEDSPSYVVLRVVEPAGPESPLLAIGNARRRDAGSFDVFIMYGRTHGHRAALVRRDEGGWRVDWYSEVANPAPLAGVKYRTERTAIEAAITEYIKSRRGSEAAGPDESVRPLWINQSEQ